MVYALRELNFRITAMRELSGNSQVEFPITRFKYGNADAAHCAPEEQ